MAVCFVFRQFLPLRFAFQLIALAAILVGGTEIGLARVITPTGIRHIGTAVETWGDEIRLIDGSGLNGALNSEADFNTVRHSSANPSRSWVTNAPNGGNGNDYFRPGGNGGTVIFELTLDQRYTIDSVASWAYHFGSRNSNFAKTIRFDFSVDAGATFASNQTVDFAFPSNPNSAASVINLTPVDANFVRFEVIDNFFGSGVAGGDRVGLSELRFGGEVSAVPEPSTLGLAALLVAGMSAVVLRQSRIFARNVGRCRLRNRCS
ncbi:MAG: hypothetical protein AAFP90_13760 [Planctomycetota bacterium]